MVWWIVFIFILGLCIGSFLNVLIYRLPRSLAITGRSFCPKCKKKISWRENIPLLSFIFLGGRCRWCHFPVSFQYPLVELITGLLTIFVVYHILIYDIFIYDIFAGIYYLLLIYSLIVVFVVDLQHQIIPDQIVYPAILISLLFSIFNFQFSIFNFLLSAFVASGFFLFLHLLTRGRGMGLGDVKLAFLMGLVLGFPKIAAAFYLAFLTGAFGGVILILLGRKRFGQQIPFGPFLVGATLISLFWGQDLWQIFQKAIGLL